MNKENTAFAQRSSEKIHFDHKDMDYYLSWMMGREIYDGSDRTELLETAQKIPNANVEAWYTEWSALARTHRSAGGRGASKRRQGIRPQTIPARQHLSPRSAVYHGAEASRFLRALAEYASLLPQSRAVSNPVIEPIEVPFEGKTLSGYFWGVDQSKTPRPTLVVVGGVETWAEDCYFFIGSSAAEHGYNVITADLAGQGMNPDKGLHFGARMEVTAKALVDYALTRPEVDPNRLALFGFSWGGHIAFKAARFDPRLKAMIANPPMPDVFRSVLAQQKGHNRHDPISRTAFDQIVWRFGLKISFNPKDIAARFAKAYDYLTNGKVDVRKIQIPALLMAGEGEAGGDVEDRARVL
jgi:pimeloyl-ACP methyl ester carboxylesterase